MQMDRIYGIYDVKAERVIGALQLIPSDGAAVRMFNDIIKSPDNIVSQHPSDYALACFGTLAPDQTGRLRVDPFPDPLSQFVITGYAIVKGEPSPDVDPTQLALQSD